MHCIWILLSEPKLLSKFLGEAPCCYSPMSSLVTHVELGPEVAGMGTAVPSPPA